MPVREAAAVAAIPVPINLAGVARDTPIRGR
jgi:hypothetical protein